MTVHVSWGELAIRLLLTLVAGGLIGFDRGEHPRPVGLRTTLLVCLAASVSMMQAALLMDSRGKPSDSFVVLDLMRFPLGILSGIGFIGAGAILRRGDIVRGVTTAATLWFVTVIGLCLGGGQLLLGMASTLLALAVLAGVRRFERRLPTQHRGRMQVSTVSGGPSENMIRQRLSEEAFHVRAAAIRFVSREDRVELELEIYWKAPHEELRRPSLLEHLRNDPQVLQVSWRPQV